MFERILTLYLIWVLNFSLNLLSLGLHIMQRWRSRGDKNEGRKTKKSRKQVELNFGVKIFSRAVIKNLFWNLPINFFPLKSLKFKFNFSPFKIIKIKLKTENASTLISARTFSYKINENQENLQHFLRFFCLQKIWRGKLSFRIY